MDDRAKSSIVADIVRLADVWCDATGATRSGLSRSLFNRGGQLEALDAGRRDLNTRSAETAIVWLSANWPADTAWPADITRPLAEAAA